MIILCVAWVLLPAKVLSERSGKHEFHVDFQQKDYNITVERIEIVHYDKQWVNFLDVRTFKYNRTCTAFNMTLNVKLDFSKVDVITQAYKFLSNEYRLFPFRFQYNACKGLTQDFAGFLKSSCGNFTGCPLILGKTYRLCKWTIDQSKFPPFFPSGRYMVEFQFLYYLHRNSVPSEVVFAHAYTHITRPEV